MTYANYIVKFGDIGGTTDITDRVTGLQVLHRCTVGRLTDATAVLTIENNDGAFTPDIGGTYSSVDWFTQAVQIDKGSSSYPIFHGIIEQVTFQDDGVNSTVVLQCLDALTIGGRSVAERYGLLTNGPLALHTLAEAAYNGFTIGTLVQWEPAGLPKLGGANNATVNIDVKSSVGLGSPWYTAFSGTAETFTVSDYVNNSIMPSYDVVAWPTTVDLSGPSAIFNASLAYRMTRDTPTTFSFGVGGIPIERLQVGYRNELLYNSSQTETRYPANTGAATNNASIDNYGVSGVRLFDLAGGFVADGGTPNSWGQISGYTTLESCADFTATVWANHFAEVRYAPITMSILLEAADGAGIPEATMHALMSTDGLWQIAEITYRPTGAASDITATCVIAGRTVQAVPGRTTLVLQLLPAQDYGAFTLDSDVLGVLDQNRLG